MIRRAVILGATSGIGFEVAKKLVKDGVVLGVSGRRVDRLEALVNEFHEKISYLPIDVTADNAGDALLSLIEKVGGVDLVLISSGIGSQNLDLNPDIELNTVKTNVEGFTRVVCAAFNYFKEKGGGQIAVISSIAGTKGLGSAAAYSATKRYQNTYIQCLAQLSCIKGYKISFTDIRPGFVDTDLLKSGKYPMLMKPDYVAELIVKALKRRKRVAVIDWRYKILVALWRLIPRCVWERLKIKN